MSLEFWLNKSLELAQKEKKKLIKENEDLLGLKAVSHLDIKKYLSISTEERMARSDKLMKKIIETGFDVSRISNLIFFERRKR